MLFLVVLWVFINFFWCRLFSELGHMGLLSSIGGDRDHGSRSRFAVS